jgi:hypothetical protein
MRASDFKIRSVVASIGCLTVLACAGCGADGLELHAVTGTVTFKDGSVPQGEMSTITFTPVNPMVGKAASSTIAPDGSFELYTARQGDGGALAGEYRVTLNVITGYPRGTSLVSSAYTNLNETPLEATVKASEENHFKFEVDRP